MKLTFSPTENSLLTDLLEKARPVRELADTYILRKGLSRAGFYKAMASLRKKEVVVVRKHFASINKIWLADVASFFNRLQARKRIPGYLAEQVAKLKSKERLEYTFRSIADIDIFILNLTYDLLLLGKEKRLLIEEAHEFFVLLNTNRTTLILKEMRRLGACVSLLIHSGSSIDKEIVATLEATGQGYATGTNKHSRKILHSVGDVIIELQLNRVFAASLDSVYKKHPRITHDLIEKVESLASEDHRHRILIYRSPFLGEKMKRRFGKYFA